MFTYQQLIRIYGTNVANGTSDTDLDARERRLVRVMLNVASNDDRADVMYPPTDATRDAVVRYLGDAMWNGARAIAEAASPGLAVDRAHERTVMILRNM